MSLRLCGLVSKLLIIEPTAMNKTTETERHRDKIPVFARGWGRTQTPVRTAPVPLQARAGGAAGAAGRRGAQSLSPIALEDLCKVGDGAAQRPVAKDVFLASSISIKFCFHLSGF